MQQGGDMKTVTSKDGTKIAYDQIGMGPPVILIGGALVSRSDHSKLAQLLSRTFTVYNYDRRGRGDSGDAQRYDVAREVEDIKAIIDETGAAHLYGISSGACLALEAASALGAQVKKLAIYEAPYDEATGVAEKWKDFRLKLNQLLAEGRRGDAVQLHLKTVGVPALGIIAMKVLPVWRRMKALAPTIAYDISVVGENRSIPVERIARIEAEVLVIDGGDSLKPMPFMRATADKLANSAPHAYRHTIKGQGHNVDDKVIAQVLIDFFTKEIQTTSRSLSLGADDPR
jgi:pimeloyl-ACP methyl ester carboxylesterase